MFLTPYIAGRILIFITALVLISHVWLRTRANAQEQPPSDSQTSFQQLDEQAVRASDSDDARVRDLTHAVVASFSWARQMSLGSEPEDRISRAEIAFRSGKHPAITEQKVVTALNKLCNRLNLPEYARTNLSQVRYLRMALMVGSPHLMGTTSLDKHQLSPTEAAYLAMSLIHQKLHNPKFQVTEKQWHENRYTEEWSRWNDHRLGKPEASSGETILVSLPNPQGDALTQSIQNGLAALTDAEQNGMTDSLLDEMGVAR